MAKTPHLTQLFVTGKSFTLDLVNPSDLDNPYKVELWLRKPSVTQYEEGLSKARGKQGRRRALYRDKTSDEYLAISEGITDLDKDGVVKEIMNFEDRELRTQAFNEALYGDNDEDEPRWGKEGMDYLDVLAGLQARHEEIRDFNDALDAEDRETMMIKVEDDEEVLRLNKVIDDFGDHRDEVYKKLSANKEAELLAKSTDTLRKDLIKRMIDLDLNLVHYQEFKTWMVYFAVREPDDHSKQYFRSPDDIWGLPDHVRIKLFDAYDELEQDSAQLKN